MAGLFAKHDRHDFAQCRGLTGHERKAVVFLFPPMETITGGMLSILNLALISREILEPEGWHVYICGLPGSKISKSKLLSPVQDIEILDFIDFVQLVPPPEHLIIHIPEYIAEDVFRDKAGQAPAYLRDVPNLRFNILNQNITLMPPPYALAHLWAFSVDITQTTAHIRYSNKAVCDRWHMPLHHLPAMMSKTYPFSGVNKKGDIILYSADFCPESGHVLETLKKRLPGFSLEKIQGLSYEQYQRKIAGAKYVISFGEGMDGYFCEPFMCGSVGVAVYNSDFFPDSSFKRLTTVYNGYEELASRLPDHIAAFENDPRAYEDYSASTCGLLKNYNSWERLTEALRSYYSGAYTFQPGRPVLADGGPLLTVNILAGKHESKIRHCLDSLLSQITSFCFIIRIFNIDSTDGTINICREYADRYPEKIFIHGAMRENGASKYFMNIGGNEHCCNNRKLELQVQALEDYPSCVLATHSVLEANVNTPRRGVKMREDGIFKIENISQYAAWQNPDGSCIVRSRAAAANRGDIYSFKEIMSVSGA